jgi:hypothetical protein
MYALCLCRGQPLCHDTSATASASKSGTTCLPAGCTVSDEANDEANLEGLVIRKGLGARLAHQSRSGGELDEVKVIKADSAFSRYESLRV